MRKPQPTAYRAKKTAPADPLGPAGDHNPEDSCRSSGGGYRNVVRSDAAGLVRSWKQLLTGAPKLETFCDEKRRGGLSTAPRAKAATPGLSRRPRTVVQAPRAVQIGLEGLVSGANHRPGRLVNLPGDSPAVTSRGGEATTLDTLCRLRGEAPRGETAPAQARSDTEQPVAGNGLDPAIARMAGMAGRAPRDPKSLPRLLQARKLIIQHGWGRSGHPDRWTLVSAVQDGSLESWHALELLRELAGQRNLVSWNDAPERTGTDVIALIDRAIRELGATPPRARYRAPRRRGGRAGGWTVGTHPTRATRESWPDSPEPAAGSITLHPPPAPTSSRAEGPAMTPGAEADTTKPPAVRRLVEYEATLHALRVGYRELAAELEQLGPEASGLRLEVSDMALELEALVRRANSQRIRAMTFSALRDERCGATSSRAQYPLTCELPAGHPGPHGATACDPWSHDARVHCAAPLAHKGSNAPLFCTRPIRHDGRHGLVLDPRDVPEGEDELGSA